MTDDENISQKKFKILLDLQQSESRLHWQRNNIFLVITSFFLLAYSQFTDNLTHLILTLCGIVINVAWLLIQIGSNNLIKKWIRQIQELEGKLKFGHIFTGEPKPPIAIRKLVYVFPIIFVFLWLYLMIFSIIALC